MIVEQFVNRDFEGLKELQPGGWSDIIPFFHFYVEHSFCTPVKVCHEDELIGIGSGIIFDTTAWLAHIIVRPRFRGRGIGGQIVEYLMDRLESTGCETVSLIATELGYPVYRKHGFTEQTEYLFFERKEAGKEHRISESIQPVSDENTSDVLALDEAVSGENRRRILVDRMKDAVVFVKGGEASGSFLPALGEGLIVADEPEAGIELMKLKYRTSNKAVLPLNNRAGIEFLTANGFVETLRAKRMVFGKEFSWHPERIYSRIGGDLG